jgi:hypothetical protein
MASHETVAVRRRPILPSALLRPETNPRVMTQSDIRVIPSSDKQVGLRAVCTQGRFEKFAEIAQVFSGQLLRLYAQSYEYQ